MPEVYVTRHAIKRYQERVADVPAAQIWRSLDCPAVRIAIEFGARFVRLAGGQRLVLEGSNIITVLPEDYCTGSLDRRHDGHFRDGGSHAQG